MYYDIGLGKDLSFKNILFDSDVEVIQNFDSTIAPCKSMKNSSAAVSSRKYNDSLFCPQVNCANFYQNVELARHIAIGDHTSPNTLSGINKVKKEYAKRVQLTFFFSSQ